MISYQSVERNEHTWLIALVVFLASGAAGGLFWALAKFDTDKIIEKGGETEWLMLLGVLGLSILALGLVVAAVLMLQLRIRIEPTQITLQLWPLMRPHKIDLKEIISVESVKFRPLRDHGGWGIRFYDRMRGRAYTLNGTTGVKLTLQNGHTRILGTPAPERLLMSIEQARLALR